MDKINSSNIMCSPSKSNESVLGETFHMFTIMQHKKKLMASERCLKITCLQMERR